MNMKSTHQRWSALLLVSLIAGVIYGMGCGSSGDATSSGSTGGGGGTTTSVKSLSTIPSVDLSSYDRSASAASASESAPLSLGKGLGDKNPDAEGNTSRAGCEADSHKKEIILESQLAQLDRCYVKAMADAGLVTIPDGGRALYKIVPPEMNENQKSEFCNEIPDEDTERKQACQSGGEGPADGNILGRIGIIDGGLEIDLCEGKAGAEVQVNQSTYVANGSKYTAAITRIGKWGGHEERMDLDLAVDVGASGKVQDEVVDLGTDGTVRAVSKMSGGHGSGAMTFAATADGVNTLTGGFKGSFKDPKSKAESKFTGKAHYKGDNKTGCAKFSFTGTMPPMLVKDMVPFNISAAQLENFLKSFGAQLGIELTPTNYKTKYLCPNPNFDPDNPGKTVKPMIAANSDNSCGEVTHSDIECFKITTATEKGGFSNKVKQVYTIIANSASSYFTAVNAFDLSTVSADAGSIAFSRAWDCKGDFTLIDFQKLTPEQIAAAEKAMSKCFAIEEKLHDNNGMGGYDCHEQEQKIGVNDFAKEGPKFGLYDGDLTATAGGTCSTSTGPSRLFIDDVNTDANQYCLPLGQGPCNAFTVSANSATGLSINVGGGNSITTIAFTQAGQNAATAATITLLTSEGTSCTKVYTLSQPVFDKPPEFGQGGGGSKPGDQGFMPTPCRNAGATTEAACMKICGDPKNDCSK